MGQPMSRLFGVLTNYFLTLFNGERQQQETRSNRTDEPVSVPEYSGDDMSSSFAGAKNILSSGQMFFGSHFLMGGELYDTSKPEVFLFGDQQDLELLGNRPVKFPHCQKGVTDSVNVLNALVNVRKDSIKFTKVGRARGIGYSSGFYRLEFIFDCDVSCYVQIHFCAREYIDEHQQIRIISRQSQFDSSERYHFPIGANQQFSHFIFKPHRYDLKLMHWDGGINFPILIEIRTVSDQYPEHVQTTMCSIERSVDQSATLILKPLKQKLISNGVVFLLQEIFGIENKENAESFLVDENGAECIICMANPRDTMILPCRHLCICNGCAETLRYKLNNCPICRSSFKALLKIRSIRSSLVGLGIDNGTASTRIRREPMTLFEALNGPFHYVNSNTPILPSKAFIVTKCVLGNRGNISNTTQTSTFDQTLNNPNATILNSTSGDSISGLPKEHCIKKENQPSNIVNESGKKKKEKYSTPTNNNKNERRQQLQKRIEVDIEHIELEDFDPRLTRKHCSHSSFIQYSPGSSSITRRRCSSPSPIPFSTANSSYQSARSLTTTQKINSENEEANDEEHQLPHKQQKEKYTIVPVDDKCQESAPNLTNQSELLEKQCLNLVGAERKYSVASENAVIVMNEDDVIVSKKETKIDNHSKRMSEPPSATSPSSSGIPTPIAGKKYRTSKSVKLAGSSRLPTASGKPL